MPIDRTDTDRWAERGDAMACAYPHVPVGDLRPRVEGDLRRLSLLRGGRHTETVSRDLLVTTGWLTLLAACLHKDAGDTVRALQRADTVESIGGEAGHPELAAWARELRVWQWTDEQRWPEAAALATAAAERVEGSNVSVQLRMHAAMSHAALGQHSEMFHVLNLAEHTVETLPEPFDPAHHFVFDGRKWPFYLARIFGRAQLWRQSGECMAVSMIQCLDEDGRTRWPMRLAALRLESAVAAAQRGLLDEAVGAGLRALRSPRECAGLLPRMRELDGLLYRQWSSESMMRDYRAALRQVERRFAQAAPARR